jgi:hypothetical protein
MGSNYSRDDVSLKSQKKFAAFPIHTIQELLLSKYSIKNIKLTDKVEYGDKDGGDGGAHEGPSLHPLHKHSHNYIIPSLTEVKAKVVFKYLNKIKKKTIKK